MRRVLLVLVALSAANAFAFRPEVAGQTTFWLAVSVPYLLAAGLSAHKLWDDGTLVDLLKPKWGDLSIGAVTALLLLLASWSARSVLAPVDSARHGWLMRVYLQIGPTEELQRSALMTAILIGVPICEELVWRGMVQEALAEKLGTRRAGPLTALLYALVLVPTVITLADPVAGPNPLLVLAALGCGLVWGITRTLTGRLPPVIFSHVAFTYFSAVQFRWPGM